MPTSTSTRRGLAGGQPTEGGRRGIAGVGKWESISLWSTQTDFDHRPLLVASARRDLRCQEDKNLGNMKHLYGVVWLHICAHCAPADNREGENRQITHTSLGGLVHASGDSTRPPRSAGGERFADPKSLVCSPALRGEGSIHRVAHCLGRVFRAAHWRD